MPADIFHYTNLIIEILLCLLPNRPGIDALFIGVSLIATPIKLVLSGLTDSLPFLTMSSMTSLACTSITTSAPKVVRFCLLSLPLTS